MQLVWCGTSNCGLRLWPRVSFSNGYALSSFHLGDWLNKILLHSAVVVAGLAWYRQLWPQQLLTRSPSLLPPPFSADQLIPFPIPSTFHSKSKTFKLIAKNFWQNKVSSDVLQNLSFLLSDIVVLQSLAAWMDESPLTRLPPHRL